jgi:hypothetical protein
MGSVVQAVCSCGYQSAELLDGFGMMFDGPVYQLFTCDRCREVRAVNVRTKRPRCPGCRRSIRARFRSHEKWVDKEPPALPCPRCAAPALVLNLLAIWD